MAKTEFTEFTDNKTISALIDLLVFDDVTVIRDDDAATVGAPCWYAARGSIENITKAYEAEGGTVSAIYPIRNQRKSMISPDEYRKWVNFHLGLSNL